MTTLKARALRLVHFLPRRTVYSECCGRGCERARNSCERDIISSAISRMMSSRERSIEHRDVIFSQMYVTGDTINKRLLCLNPLEKTLMLSDDMKENTILEESIPTIFDNYHAVHEKLEHIVYFPPTRFRMDDFTPYKINCLRFGNAFRKDTSGLVVGGEDGIIRIYDLSSEIQPDKPQFYNDDIVAGDSVGMVTIFCNRQILTRHSLSKNSIHCLNIHKNPCKYLILKVCNLFYDPDMTGILIQILPFIAFASDDTGVVGIFDS
ncbi:hypothetical protein MAR_001276 [Mya arenaria]|uniref:Uncharacterized protein n=1 Tax=Mya arenaria TaxID=6604 RepID=A0ABY7FB99_MYAAR|nr:hypothetical protein MAR_001276 [Mya arenaria]